MQAPRWTGSAYPSEHIEDVTLYALAVRRFRRLCLAFTVLKDAERRRIYMAAGYAGLRSSEAYQESWLGLGLERTLTLTLTLTLT